MSAEVSAVVPTHNRGELLALTLRTVLWQRDVDLEVVVVDDGTPDPGLAAGVVAERADPRVRLLRHDSPQGVSAARNRGIAAATGQWLAFCDDDDLWAPDKLRRQLDAAAQTGRDWAYTGAVKVNRSLRIVGGQPPAPPDLVHRRLPRWSLVPGGCSSVVARRRLVQDVDGFDDQLSNLADWDLWIRLGQRGPPAWMPRPLVGYRVHPGNASGNTRSVLRELERLDGRYGPRADRAAVHHYLAWVALRSGDRRTAARHFLHAAVRGEPAGVARSLTALARGRLRRTLGRSAPPHAEWRRQAEEWLQLLR